MKVSEILTFETYWSDPRFQIKKPIRNGSPVIIVGDNIYHRDVTTGDWFQENSHHSNPDGSTNHRNLKTDTKSSNVLVSTHFYYFGSAALAVNLASIGYTNGIGHRKKSFKDVNVVNFLKTIEDNHRMYRDIIVADPFNFEQAEKRVDQSSGKIV